MGKSLNYFAGISPLKRDADILIGLALQYGSYLESLNRENKLVLRAVLTRYICDKNRLAGYLIVDAIADTLPDFSDLICAILLELQGLSDKGIEILIELVTVQQIKEFIAD